MTIEIQFLQLIYWICLNVGQIHKWMCFIFLSPIYYVHIYIFVPPPSRISLDVSTQTFVRRQKKMFSFILHIYWYTFDWEVIAKLLSNKIWWNQLSIKSDNFFPIKWLKLNRVMQLQVHYLFCIWIKQL